MKIIISPAKKMNIREDELEWANLPCFLSRAEELKRYIQGLDLDQARKLWQCNEKIALLNYGRFKEMDLERRLTPALLSYEGIQYQYMAPGVFEQGQWDYVQEHLRILSGFYGILKPLRVPDAPLRHEPDHLSSGHLGLGGFHLYLKTACSVLCKGSEHTGHIINMGFQIGFHCPAVFF